MRKIKGKTIDNLRNMGCNVGENQNHWLFEDSITTIGERYKRADINIHVHVRSTFSDFCAIFQYGEAIGGEGVRPVAPVSISNTSRSDSCNLDNPVLIRIVNLFEPKEGAIASTPFGQITGFEQITTTAVVWLQPLDTCLMFRAKQLNHILPLSVEFPSAQKDWKLKPLIPCDCFGFVRTIQEGKLIDNMIECRTQVMGNLSNMNSPVKRKWRTIYFSAIDILTRYRILLCPDNAIMGILEKDILHRPKSVNFSLCSSNLEAWAIERMHMLYYLQGDTYGRKEAKDSKGTRDTRTHKRRIRAQSEKGGEDRQVNAPKPEEVASQTSHAHHSGGCTANNTRLGSLEDA